jgi:hypothetical protein
VFGFWLRVFVLRGGFGIPTTATITQFARGDKEVGTQFAKRDEDLKVNEESGHCAGIQEGMKNEKRAFVATECATKRQIADKSVGATKRQKGSGSEEFRTKVSCVSVEDSSPGTPEDSGESKNIPPGTQEDLTRIGQEVRDRKATKLDNAGVPEYIWYRHVFEDGTIPRNEEQKRAFPPAAKILQGAMLKFWKKQV